MMAGPGVQNRSGEQGLLLMATARRVYIDNIIRVVQVNLRLLLLLLLHHARVQDGRQVHTCLALLVREELFGRRYKCLLAPVL